MQNFTNPTTNQLSALLTGLGIQPLSFAFFLTEFIKRNPEKGSSAGALLLNEIMKVQAELILFNLNH